MRNSERIGTGPGRIYTHTHKIVLHARSRIPWCRCSCVCVCVCVGVSYVGSGMVYEGVCLYFVRACVHKCMARARASVIVVGNMNAQSRYPSLTRPPLGLRISYTHTQLRVRKCGRGMRNSERIDTESGIYTHTHERSARALVHPLVQM
jgi:hypothetical protein